MANKDLTLMQEVFDGMKDCLPVFFSGAPFGILFGTAAIAAGLTWQEAIFSSLIMFAGASQFVFIEMNGLGIPAWSLALAVFAVNFRHILYSASIGRKLSNFSFLQKIAAFFLLTDPQWASSELRYEKQKLRPAYYFGFGILFYLMWISATTIGILSGSLIEDPAALGLDFVVPIYFLTLLVGFRNRSKFYTIVFVSAVSSYLFYLLLGAPWHVSLGALCGVFVAVCMPINQNATKPDNKGEEA